MKNYRYISALFIITLLTVTSCVNDPEAEGGLQNADLPKVEILSLDRVARAITIHAESKLENGSPIAERGVEWRLATPDASAVFTKIKDSGNGKGTYTLSIENILIDTAYQVRAYAVNEVGTAYSEIERIETTVGKASIETLTADSIHAEWAICGGKIKISGEGEPIGWGIYFSSHPELTDKDSLAFDKPIAADSTFRAVVTNLTPNKKYYFQAYYKNEYGVSLGEIKSLETTAGTPDIGNLKIVSFAYTEATLSAEVLKENDKPVTARGFLWGKEKLPPKDANGELKGDTILVGEGLGSFSGTIKNLEPNTQYYVRAFARNGYGIVYTDSLELTTSDNKPTVATGTVTDVTEGTAKASGTLIKEGESAVTSVGVCWGTSPEPTLEKDQHLEMTLGEGGTFSGTITGLVGSKAYYVRAYATNATTTSYGQDVMITTPGIFTIGLASFPGQKRLPGSMAYLSIENKGYILGGDLGASKTNELWMYNADLNAWQGLEPFSGKGRKWQSIVRSYDDLIVFGGLDNENKATNELYYYSYSSNIWYSLSTTNLPAPTYMSTAGSIGDLTYFIGGRRDSIIPVISEVWKYISSGTWERMADFPEPQYEGINVIIDEKIYAGLGLNSSGKSNNTLWYSSKELTAWDKETSTYPGEKVVAGVALDKQIFVIDQADVIWMYDTNTKIWNQKSTLPISGMHCMFVLNNAIYIGLGQNGTTLLKYNPAWDVKESTYSARVRKRRTN